MSIGKGDRNLIIIEDARGGAVLGGGYDVRKSAVHSGVDLRGRMLG